MRVRNATRTWWTDSEAMERFEAYLQERGLAPATVALYRRGVARLIAFLEQEGLQAQTVSYRDLLAWLRWLDVSARSRNLLLTAIRHYLTYLVEEGRRLDNPARGLVVRGERRRLPHDLLTKAQLDDLYQRYPTGTPAQQRNKAMLGLLVYQGLTTRELARLEVEDVDLEGGLVLVRGSRTSEGRLLWLDGRQILGLHRYLREARPVLLAATGKMTDRLFVSAGSGGRLHNALAVLMRQLRRRHAWFGSARQVRASRLALWLKVEHLRKVQHKAGHRFVSLTERYQAADLDRLLASLSKHHPLG